MNNLVLDCIYMWNKERDNLGKYDPALEFGMLQEECLEYAHSYIKTVNDYVGFDIHQCTEEEYLGVKTSIDKYLDTEEFLEDWKVNQLDALCDVIFVAVGSMSKLLKDKELVAKALIEVITANEQKSKTKNVEGKITKPANFVGPEEELRYIIRDSYEYAL